MYLNIINYNGIKNKFIKYKGKLTSSVKDRYRGEKMEGIKKDNHNKKSSSHSEDLLSRIKVYTFSLIGIVIFFIPIKINNQYDTLIYHISYFIENKASTIINISMVLFIMLSILKNIMNIDKLNINKVSVLIKVFSLIILIFILIGKEDVFFINDSFIFILKDLLLELSIILPVSSLFMPFLLDSGLVEITEAYTHKFMKKMFRVSGKVVLNFLVYLLVNMVCGVFVTHRLYKDGKLRERECDIIVLNFSVISLSLTEDLCSKININTYKFFVIEIISLIICNFIISRIYPLNKKKQSYYYKSGYKNVNCKRNKLKVAIKRYYQNKSNKKLINLSLSYLNDAIYILMDLIPLIIIIFFIGNIIYNIPLIMDMIDNFIYILISKINIPNSRLISNIVSLNFFNNILAIKLVNKDTYYISKIMIGLLIALQCISISFLIPFIKKSTIKLNLREILVVAIERLLIILFICFIIYKFYLLYIV